MSFFNVGTKRKYTQNYDQSIKYQAAQRTESLLSNDLHSLLHWYFPSRYDETLLGDVSDPYDEVVFQAVLERFERDVQVALKQLQENSKQWN